MTYRDDCFKTMGQLRPLMLILKSLPGGNTIIAADAKLKAQVETAHQMLTEAYTLVSEKAYKMPDGTKSTKVLVLPKSDSKEGFAIEAMMEAFGLKAQEAVITELVTDRPQLKNVAPVKPPLGPRTEPPKPAPTKLPSSVTPAVTSIAAEQTQHLREQGFDIPHPATEVPPPTGELPPEPTVDKTKYYNQWDAETNQWVTMSKKTGQPKRPYVRTGNFTADKIKDRSDAWVAQHGHKKVGGGSKPVKFKARRMS